MEKKETRPFCFKRKDGLTVLRPSMSAACQFGVVRRRAAPSRYVVSQLWVIFSPFFPTRLNDFISSPPPPHHLSVCVTFSTSACLPETFCLQAFFPPQSVCVCFSRSIPPKSSCPPCLSPSGITSFSLCPFVF